MKTLLLASAAGLLASAAPALAQDMAPPPADPAATYPADPAAPPPPPPPAYADGPSVLSGDEASFTGPRAEIFGGWDRIGTRVRTTVAGVRDTDRNNRDGAVGGALIGFDIPLGEQLRAGVFGTYALSTNRICDAGGGCLKAGREIEGGARLGAKFGTNMLGYVKGSYVNGQIRLANVGRSNRDGWRAGAGLEYALNRHAYVKVEYDYTRFKSYDFVVASVPGNLRFDRNQVLGGFGIHF